MARKIELKVKKYAKAPEMLASLKELLSQYNRGTKYCGLCVLCKTVGRTQANTISKTSKCKECPWVQITGGTCQDKHFTNASRKAELPGWIGLYEMSVKQHYPQALKAKITSLSSALVRLESEGFDTAGAREELRILNTAQSKLSNARYYVGNAATSLVNAQNYLK